MGDGVVTPNADSAVEIRDGVAVDEAVADAAHAILAELVAGGAALGWVDPPSRAEVGALLAKVSEAATSGDGALRLAYSGERLAGLGYWLRYERPTHRPHADLEKIAVATDAQGTGIGRLLTAALVDSARAAGVEVLTLDARGDNIHARHLYRTLGFSEYGRLPDFVAVGERRYDKVFYMLDLRR
jgi:ribosomal protein S18 acetylase RimI-like enzyme